jgi:hypothetical protein
MTVSTIIPPFLVFSFGHSNGRKMEPKFNVFDWKKHFGTHDWVMESALKLIWDSGIVENGGFREYISTWLYDPSLEIKFKNWEPMWFKFRYTSSPLNLYKDGIRDKKQWLFIRRRFRLLHSTLAPDVATTSDTKENFAGFTLRNADVGTEEVIKPALGANNLFLDTQNHKMFFIKIGDDWYNSEFIPGDHEKAYGGVLAMFCAYLSASLLVYSRNGQSGYPRKWTKFKGLYEPAAFFLGCMSHFITDLSMPFHVLIDYYSRHTNVEQYIQNEFACYADIEKDPFVFPDWERLNPATFLTEKSLELHPMEPYYAAIRMARTTFDCEDNENYDMNSYLENPENPSLVAQYYLDWFKVYGSWDDFKTSHTGEGGALERLGELINWAVYYVACVTLYICQLAGTKDLTDEQTVEGRIGSRVDSESGVSATSLLTPYEVADWFKEPSLHSIYEVNKRFSEASTFSFGAQMMMMSPLLGLVLVAALANATEQANKIQKAISVSSVS